MESSRKARHAGSWYSDNGQTLDAQLTKWLNDATVTNNKTPRAIIAPHAGYSYSGSIAAYAYKHINPEGIKRVFILGPSHHVSIEGCSLSQQAHYETPLGNLPLDRKTIKELADTGHFGQMDKRVDENEHSIELHLPYIAKMFKGTEISLVPVLVGSAPKKLSETYAKIFCKYLENPENFFVISSDFCHWGSRFQFTWYDSSHGHICDSIEWLDRKGMNIIETLDPAKFRDYRKEYQNTICGRNPIILLLHTIQNSSNKFELSFVKYAQSSKCKAKTDSSVSYASAVVWLKDGDESHSAKRKRGKDN